MDLLQLHCLCIKSEVYGVRYELYEPTQLLNDDDLYRVYCGARVLTRQLGRNAKCSNRGYFKTKQNYLSSELIHAREAKLFQSWGEVLV